MSRWEFVVVGICLSGKLSSGILSEWEIVVGNCRVGNCPSGKLSRNRPEEPH